MIYMLAGDQLSYFILWFMSQASLNGWKEKQITMQSNREEKKDAPDILKPWDGKLDIKCIYAKMLYRYVYCDRD